ncbi:hypothetical protein [Sphingomonas sp.]|uniref:hypothetical protein n=1 Tax=Sphingomonas sp. TaxID=28214 RepID=UPI003B3BCFF1
MDLAATFANVAAGVSARFGGPYVAGKVLGETDPVYDDGGSIIVPGGPTERACMVQIDKATWDMQQSAGYVRGDMLFLILTASLEGDLTADERVQVITGPNAGLWQVSGLQRDAMGIYWAGTGREAA